MSIVVIDGKPGTGKTLLLTYLAYKNFKKKNPPLKVWFTEKIRRKKWVYELTDFADYPILFKKKKKNKFYLYNDENSRACPTYEIYCAKGRIFDMYLGNRFPQSTNFYIDEIQTKYDSMDYKDFPDSIAHYWQTHRHLINNIYTDSQSQARIIKRVLCLGEEYWTITSSRVLFGFVILHINVSFDMHNNLESNNGNISVNSEDRRIIFRLKNIGNRYDSKYMKNLQTNAKTYPIKMYNSLQMTREEILHNFFPTKEEKENLKNIEY